MMLTEFFILDQDKLYTTFYYKNYLIIYNGLFFIDNKKAGKESIQYFIDYHFNFDTNYFNFSIIKGAFYILITNKKTNETIAFTDNSGMYKIYHYNNKISNSFLTLLNYLKKKDEKLKLNYKAINEFLHFGFYYFDETPIDKIYRLNKNKYYLLKNDDYHILDKKIGNINSSLKTVNIEKFFTIFSSSIKDKKISLDLTGGFDSRLITVLIQKNISDFELAMSGIRNNKDIKIAQKISNILQKKFIPSYHNISNLTYELLEEVFSHTDSQIDIIHYHRLYQYFKQRKKRNVDIFISGVAGELYKEFWWTQDFPFYNSKKIRLDRLYDYRIEGKKFPHNILGPAIKELSFKTKDIIINSLKKFILETNTKTYDNIYYNYKMYAHASTYLTIVNNNCFMAYAPLMELDLTKIGFHLKRHERFFNFFHRKIISKNCPKISKIKTTDMISSSNNMLFLAFDLFLYSFDKLKKIFKHILQKLLNKTFFIEKPYNEKIYEQIKKFPEIDELFYLLKQEGIISTDITINNINNILLGRIITIAFFIKEFNR